MASHLKNLSDFSHTIIPDGSSFKIAIVVAEWNAKITGALYEGALRRRQLRLVLGGKMKAADAGELKALFIK